MKKEKEKLSDKPEGVIFLTDNNINDAIKKSGLSSGIITVFSIGSTAGVTTIEYEPGLLKDLPDVLNRLVPKSNRYHHDSTWGDGNGYAHIRSSLLKTSLTIPFVNSEPTLGTWQQVVFVDFDNRPRERKIVFQVIGE